MNQVHVRHMRNLCSELKALEPELDQQKEEQKRQHVRYLSGLWAGFAIASGMLSGGVFAGISGQPWLAVLLTGPSFVALAKLFVIRRADASNAREISRLGHDVMVNLPADMQPYADSEIAKEARGGMSGP